MSVLDQLRDVERQVVGRLRQLEPLMREYEQLRKAAQRFGIKYTPRSDAAASSPRSSTRRSARTTTAKSTASTPATTTQKRPATRSARGTGKSPATSSPAQRSRARRRAAPPGQRTEEVLRLVGENPGITTSEIGRRLNVNSTGLYRVVRRLTDEGRLRKDGAQLHLVESGPRTPDAAPKQGPSAGSEAVTPADSTASDGGT